MKDIKRDGSGRRKEEVESCRMIDEKSCVGE